MCAVGKISLHAISFHPDDVSTKPLMSQHSLDLPPKRYFCTISKCANQSNCRLLYTSSRKSVQQKKKAKPVRSVPLKQFANRKALAPMCFTRRYSPKSHFSNLRACAKHQMREGLSSFYSAKCSCRGRHGFRPSRHSYMFIHDTGEK